MQIKTEHSFTMRPLLIALVGLALLSCKEEPIPLKFRAPQQVQSVPTSSPQSVPMLVITPKIEPTPSSRLLEPFTCELDGKPWILAPGQKLQGLLLQRPGLSKEQPATRLITISLQGITNERLLLELTADTPKIESLKLTLTTKDTVAKGRATLRDVEQKEEPETIRLSFAFDAELQTLGSSGARTLRNCRLQDVIVRSLQTKTPPIDD